MRAKLKGFYMLLNK